MKKKKSRSKGGEGEATDSSSQSVPADHHIDHGNSMMKSLSNVKEGMSSDMEESWIVRAAIENGGDRSVPSRGTLDRGTLAQCLNATSQIAAECNSILRDLLRGRYVFVIRRCSERLFVKTLGSNSNGRRLVTCGRYCWYIRTSKCYEWVVISWVCCHSVDLLEMKTCRGWHLRFLWDRTSI